MKINRILLDDTTEESVPELKGKVVGNVKTAKPLPTRQPVERKAEPIKLSYKYSGHCPKCKLQVETLVLDIGGKGKQTVVAWCHAHKQLESKIVSKL